MSFLNLISETLWFFLPILIANQCPGFMDKFNLPLAHRPISQKWIGVHKTWGAYFAGAIGALVIIYFQRLLNLTIGLFNYNRADLWLVGISFGVGAVLGDHLKSLIKRRIGIYPGVRWWPFDQIDGIVGGFLLAWPLTGWIGWSRLAVMLFLMAYLIHPFGNYLSYRLGLRKTKW